MLKLIPIIIKMGTPKYNPVAVLGTYESAARQHTKDHEPIRAFHTLEKLIKEYQFETILDIGAGEGLHANYLREHGKNVTTCDFGKSGYYKRSNHVLGFEGDYMDASFPCQYDAIWCAHVLEHQLNVNLFLRKVFTDLKEEGILAVTVPPRKPDVVGGHLSIWNAGILLYNLVMAGFDCSEARVKQYGYNISVLVRKKPADLTSLNLSHDFGDIEKLSHLFPFPAKHGFDGDIMEVNWN
ncbi:MAG: methyltransferase domain-containing protein [Nanoarchaeota archaeon]